MPKLVRPALCEVRTRVFDSARWAGYQPRSDDIIVATYSKCGTTWAQRIVSMLIFASPEARRATKT
jgi:aryl sulfotransferase